MSSPIAKEEKTSGDRALIAIHQKISHSNRTDTLAKELSRIMSACVQHLGSAKILDVGCGDMSMADKIEAILEGVSVSRVDIHDCPSNLADTDHRWQKYVKFDGVNLPFDDGEFEVAYFSDVLHHIPEGKRLEVLRSASRVAKKIVIKDHFEYGIFSRQMLRVMDWVGNFAYGISVPEEYYNLQSFRDFCSSAELNIEHLHVGIDLYRRLPVVGRLLNPRWQFIAVCEPMNPTPRCD